MPKPIDAGLLTELAKKRGTEPTNIVAIQWEINGDFSDYIETEEDLSTDPNTFGKLISLSGIDAIEKVAGGGGVGSISVVLDDKDGLLEQIIKTCDIHKRKVNIYQTFQDYTPPGIESDRTLIFSGEISSPIQYSEQNRQLAFQVLTVIESREVGFSPEQSDDFDFIDETAFGKAWPLCFGSPIRVPAVKITGAIKGTSLTRYTAITLGDLNDLCDKATTFADAESNKTLQEQNLSFNNQTDIDRITDFGSAKTSLDTTIASLVYDNPNQETNIVNYSEACRQIQLNNRNISLFTTILIEANAQITSLTSQIQSLEIQIVQAQAASPPDASLVESLQAQLVLLEDGQPANTILGTQEVKGLNDYIFDKSVATTQIAAANSNIQSLEVTKNALETSLLTITLTSIKIRGGEKFPQGVSTSIIINGAKFIGVFSGEDFTISDANIALYENISISPGLISNQFIIGNSTLNLKGQFCFLGDSIVYIESQQGTTCTFSPTLFEKSGEFSFGLTSRDLYNFKTISGNILQTSALFFASWKNALQAQVDSIVRNDGQASSAEVGSSSFSFANGLDELRAVDYNIEVGDEIFLESGFSEKYVANLIESTEVKEVMAFRLVNGIRRLVPVPSRYYVIDLAESIAGQTSTTINFPIPLSQYQDEDWEDDIYVTLTSTVGPNTASIIEYLLTTYTSVSAESTSFSDVTTKLAKFPSHFAVLDRRDTLNLVDDIAFQARCAVFLRNEEMVIRYLAESPTSIRTLSESNVALDSLQVGFTSTEQLVTKYTASWRRNYAQEDEDRGEINRIVLRNNIPIYGNHEEEREFFIYNIEELVERSATFWLIRKSNTWYSINLTGFLDQLELEPFDGVTFAFDTSDYPTLFDISSSGFRSQVRDLEYNSESKEIQFSIWRPIPAGKQSEHPLAYPASASSGVTYPTSFDLYTGGEAEI